jgi:hypothetical protein
LRLRLHYKTARAAGVRQKNEGKMTDPVENSLLETISAIATLVTPFLLLALGGIGFLIKGKIQASQAKMESRDIRIRELEDKLREDRIKTYNAILEPFFLLFTSDAAFAKDPKFKNKNKYELATAKLLSVEYREVAFKLSLVANDSVVRAYNKLMQYSYHSEEAPTPIDEKVGDWIALIGDFLLEIRKSMGNESSTLDRWEMVEWFMTETPNLKRQHMARIEK